jgi:serine/threonine protein kinase
VSKEPLPTIAEEYEQELAILIAQLADQVSAGDSPELETVCRQYPQFEQDLRELWGVVVVANMAARERAQATLPLDGMAGPQRFELPYDFGDYRLEKEIGRGGMGIVFRARRLKDDQLVAIKMILRGDFATPAERSRFEAEAKAAAHLSHPHIIPIYEIGQHDGHDFFCMKLIEGGSLSERLNKGPIEARSAAKILVQVAHAIKQAHHQGILHRDLKPSNILLDSHGDAFVVDFGLAKQVNNRNNLTMSGAVLGTPSYMAPEQATGNRGQISPSCDIYSLGAVLYHAITGRPPFLGTSPVETVMMVIEQDPVAPRVINPKCNRTLEMIAMRCLQKPTDLRYPSAGELANDLDAFLNNETVSAGIGRFSQVIGNLLRETHHASVLENWGVIWMWHSLVLLVTSLATEGLFWMNVSNRIWYWLLWTVVLGTWATVFWVLRHRMGPVTFIERQVAHVWGAAMIAVLLLFPLEATLGLPVLSLAPVLGALAGMIFLIKGGMLTGFFYLPAIVLFASSMVMAVLPGYAMLIFGFVSAGCFFVSGLKYYRRKKKR